MTTKRIDIRNERGQTMVEFALVVPILLVVVFSIIQFGILYNHYITLTDATRVGARRCRQPHRGRSDRAHSRCYPSRRTRTHTRPSSGVTAVATAWAPGADITVEATYPYDIDVLGIVVASGTLS